jgi:hypothetical protein
MVSIRRDQRAMDEKVVPNNRQKKPKRKISLVIQSSEETFSGGVGGNQGEVDGSGRENGFSPGSNLKLTLVAGRHED